MVLAYLSPKRNFEFSAGDLWAGLSYPARTEVGARYIQRIEEEGEYKAIYIKGMGIPLYWPKDFNLADLYRVLAECFCEADWHFYEVGETRVEAGDVVVDCGAAEGTFSLRVLDRAKEIVIFEPSPLFVKSLRQTFADCPQVAVVPAAVSDQEGEAFLEGDSLYGRVGDKRAGVPIRLTTIDQWGAETGSPVHFLKADVEGFEMALLRGAAQTIKRYRPKLAITVYHPENDWQEIVVYLRGLVPDYQYRVKGLYFKDSGVRPMVLHVWPSVAGSIIK